MIKIILADDHNIVRNGIRNLLEKEKNIQIIGEALNGGEVLELLKASVPDIILADMNMPGMSGIELAEKLKNDGSPVRVILLTMHDHQQYVIKAFQAGAAGYLFKNIAADELLFAIRHVHQGKQYLCAELSLHLLDRIVNSSFVITEEDNVKIDFSSRELEILNLIAEGYTNQEIADRLFTSKRTVEGHRQAMIEKTGVRNTPALIRYAIRNGLLK